MMRSQTLKFLDFTRTQKSGYLEKETLIFLQIKKIVNYTKRATKNSFVVEVTFKSIPSCSDTPDRVPQNDEENCHEALTLNSNLAEHFPK